MSIPWTEEEREILKKLWSNPEIMIDDMPKVLVSRSKQGIIHQAQRLGLIAISQRTKPKIDFEYLKKLMEVIEG